ncbi:unnamed protein product [Parajaminaea phylloscopi]
MPIASVPRAESPSSQRILPAKRSYGTHHYYAVETYGSSEVDPRDVASVLGAEFVERVGELRDHWLVRSEKPIVGAAVTERAEAVALHHDASVRADVPIQDDVVLGAWSKLAAARHTKSHGLSKRGHSAALAIRAVERQTLRRRHKRDKIYSPWDTPHLYPHVRDPIPGPEPHPYPDPSPRPPPIVDSKIAEIANNFSIHDPLFPRQWHLFNDRKLGNDLNITGVWAQNITGRGITVALIDDGVDMHSPDLADNFFAGGSYDFNSHTALPEPRESDDQHGTRCAGEIAAVKNDVCGVGVAHNAHVSGLRILSGPISDVDEAAALNYAYHENHIYSCSWGPPDDGRSMDAPKGLIAKAILNGVQNGRSGKGSIFVFAGGNGGASDDQCNFDGYTNSIYTMTIAAVDRENLHPYYSEMCSANLASGWSSGSNDHIHTTDVAWNGINRCTSNHGGTSAAAPLVAGVVALALEIRPELTWRDVQHIAVHSAQMVNPDDKDWQKTQAGRHYNHKYGYGVIDAWQFIETTKVHKLVKPQAWLSSGNITIAGDRTLIGETNGVKSTFSVTESLLKENNLESIEHVTVRVWISHERRGDVEVELTSPHGTKSVLARPRRYDDAQTGFPGWGFMTLKHWDESPIGEWTIRVRDRANPKATGNFWAWSLNFWGQAIDPLKARPWNFPETSAEFHEKLPSAPESTAVQGAGAAATYKPSKPTDHLPSDHGTQSGESHQDWTGAQSGSGAAASPEGDTGYLTGLKKNSTWLFVAAGIVIIFAASVGAFFCMRKRSRRSRAGTGDYEFVTGEDDEMQLSRLGGGAGRGIDGASGSAGRRTRDIYDAFRPGSDDELDSDDDDKDSLLKRRGDAAEPYRDDEPTDGRDDTDQRFTIGGPEPHTPASGNRGGDDAEKGGDVAAAEGDLLGRSSEEAADTSGRSPAAAESEKV